MSSVQHGDYADLQPSLGWRLRVTRERRTGLDQEAFAERINVSRGTVSNYERDNLPDGRRRRLVLGAWAMATGVSVEWLETGVAPADPEGPDGGEGTPSGTRTPNPLVKKISARRRTTSQPVVAPAAA